MNFFSNADNLSEQIKKSIGFRVFFCFILALIVIVSVSLNELHNSFSQVEKNIETQCEALSGFAIGQLLIDNAQAIQPKLDSLNKHSTTVKITWKTFSEKEKLLARSLHFSFPFSWTYFYPVTFNNGNVVGTFIVKGSFFNERQLLSEFLTKIILLLLFFTTIFIVLYPLGKKIPQKLFIAPVNHLLSLLRNEKNLLNAEKMPAEIAEIRDKITLLLDEAEERSRESALGQLAARVAHDIRSPIMSMTVLLEIISSDISEEKHRMLASSIQSVRDIANNLLARYQESNKTAVGCRDLRTCEDDGNIERYILLSSIIDFVLSQKRYEWKSNECEIQVDISPEAKTQWLFLAPNDIKRLLSNLLNNAYESLDTNRQIKVSLRQENKMLMLSIQDTGSGIPADKIEAVLNGASLKTTGHGLGLSNAKKMLAEWGGGLQLASQRGEGTEIKLFFPIALSPTWFPESITLSSQTPALFLDDDPSMHTLWMSYAFPIRMFHCMTSNDLLSWVEAHPDSKDSATFLIDYELRQDSRNGLELLEQLNPRGRGYLITSHAEEVNIQIRCANAGLWLIPKVVLDNMRIEKI